MKPKSQVHTLEDLLVEEVSVVDRPANKRRFLFVKSEGKGQEIQTDQAGNLVSGDTPTPTSAPDDIAKRLNIDPELRREIFQSLGDAMARINVVMNTADVAQTDRQGTGDSTIVPVLATELDDIAKTLSAMSRQLNKSPAKKGETPETPETETPDIDAVLGTLVESLESQVQKRGAKMSKSRLAAFKAAMDTLAAILKELEPSAVGKAVWTTAQINDFPDSSFLYVKPGGTKDSGGKTVPRTNRMFPVRDATGNLDPAHVRNAIARIPQANIPANLKASLQDKARKLLASLKAAQPAQKADANVTELTGAVGELAAVVKKQAKEIRALRMSRPGSNSIPVEKTAGNGPSTSQVSWPMDMNDEKLPERVDKATSFLES